MKTRMYVVEGSGEFPLDMLRYDQAFPASEYDAGLMAETGRRKISLMTHANHGGEGSSKVRWSSFNWCVKQF